MDDILRARGIAEVAQAAGWVSHERYGVPGWLYPVPSTKFPGVKRWKAKDSDHNPKCAWVDNENGCPPYYTLPGIREAIAATGGVVHIASGEPDVLAYHAAGITNVLSWFGENSVPDTLLADLKALGVTKVIYAPDNDKVGRASATKVRDMLALDLDVTLLAVGGAERNDINKMWIECQFDRVTFAERLKNLPPLKLDGDTPDESDIQKVYEAWCLEVERAAVATWNIADAKSNDFSRKNIPCPFHDDQAPSATWNYETHSLHCFTCGRDYNTQEVGEKLGMSWSERRKEARETLPYSAPNSTLHTGNGNGKAGMKPPAQEIKVVSSDTALSNVFDWNDGKLPPIEPILCPYSPLRALGGMAELWERGKLIGVWAGSGMGKTAFIETCLDALRQAGFDGIMWGPEWTPEEVQMKAVARYGGPTFTQQRKAHLWAVEEANHVPKSKRYGKPLTDEHHAQMQSIITTMMAWPGKMFYLDKSQVSMVDVMSKVGEIATIQRAAGRNPVLFACDYLQKAYLPGDNSWRSLEEKANVIKNGCEDSHLIGLVAAQVGKGSSRMVRNGELLDESSAQALSDQLFNLIVTLNPDYDKDECRKETATVGVIKNSSGMAPARVKVHTALYRHLWTEKVIETTEAETTLYLGSKD